MKRIDSSLVYSTGSLGELLLTAIPKQLMKDPIFWFRNQNKSVMFFLELNHEKLTIWYQIVQCHFVHTAESLVPYLKLCSLLTRTSILSTSYQLQLNGRKLSIVLFSPSSISFNDNTIVRNFYPRKFHSSKLFKDLPPTSREFTLLLCNGRSSGRTRGVRFPLIRPDACLRLKFLHRQDRISLFNRLFFFNETRIAFCHLN